MSTKSLQPAKCRVMSWTRATFLGAVGSCLCIFGIGWGCSASQDDASNSATATGQGGAGAATAAGGMGGDGGSAGDGGFLEFPCEVDCENAVVTDQCHIAVCNQGDNPGPVGACVVIAREAGTSCDDELFCTINDTCLDGQCVGGPQNTCGIQPPECEGVICNEMEQSCTTTLLDNGTPCDSPDLCLVGTECINGLCIGTTNDCFFAAVPNECHVAVCNPSTGDCEPEIGNEAELCTDVNDLCTVDKTCSGGNCVGGVAKNCGQFDIGCQIGVCDTATGQCGAAPLMNNDPCNDANLCTTGEFCLNSTCANGTDITVCANGDECCPTGCTEMNDSDCVLDVLLLGEDVSVNGQLDWDTYRMALTAAGETWDEIDLDINPVFPSAATLDMYDTIILFDESFISYANIETQRLADWLLDASADERNMFVTGVDFLQDWATAGGGTGENNLYSLWGITYIGPNAGTGLMQITGTAADPIGDPFFTTPLTLAANSDSSGDYVDQTMGPGITAGVYDVGIGGGFGRAALTHYTSPVGYKVVWLGVNFHNGLVNQSDRDALMTEVMTYFKQ